MRNRIQTSFLILVAVLFLGSCTVTRDRNIPTGKDIRKSAYVIGHEPALGIVRTYINGKNPVIIPQPVIIKGKDSIVYAKIDSALLEKAYREIDSLLAINCPTANIDSLRKAIAKQIKNTIPPDTIKQSPTIIHDVDSSCYKKLSGYISERDSYKSQYDVSHGQSLQKDVQIKSQSKKITVLYFVIVGLGLIILLGIYFKIRSLFLKKKI